MVRLNQQSNFPNTSHANPIEINVNQLQTLKTRCCNRKTHRPLVFVTDLRTIRLSEFISQVVSSRDCIFNQTRSLVL